MFNKNSSTEEVRRYLEAVFHEGCATLFTRGVCLDDLRLGDVRYEAKRRRHWAYLISETFGTGSSAGFGWLFIEDGSSKVQIAIDTGGRVYKS